MPTPTPEPRTPLYEKRWGPSIIAFGFLTFANLILPLLASLVSGGWK